MITNEKQRELYRKVGAKKSFGEKTTSNRLERNQQMMEPYYVKKRKVGLNPAILIERVISNYLLAIQSMRKTVQEKNR